MVHITLFFTLSFHIYWSLDWKGIQNLQGNFSETWEFFVATKLFLETKSTHRPLIFREDLQSGPLPWHVIPRSLTLTSFSLSSARSADVSMEGALLCTASVSMTFFMASQSSSFLAHDKCFRRHWSISSSRTSVSLFIHLSHLCDSAVSAEIVLESAWCRGEEWSLLCLSCQPQMDGHGGNLVAYSLEDF